MVSRLEPATKGKALLALGASSLLQIPSSGKHAFDRLAQLVEQVPCYLLSLGSDLSSIPRVVDHLFVEKSRL